MGRQARRRHRFGLQPGGITFGGRFGGSVRSAGAARNANLETADVDLLQVHGRPEQRGKIRAGVEGADGDERRHVGASVVSQRETGSGRARAGQHRQVE